MPVRESEPRNIEMGNQAAPGICQQGPEIELAVQNQGRGIKRSLGVHYSHEIWNEMQCTHQPIQNSQDESQRYISKYNDDYKYKKSPNVKNLRFLKTLARGPLVQASAVKRRRSTRLVDKSPWLRTLGTKHHKKLGSLMFSSTQRDQGNFLKSDYMDQERVLSYILAD